ncbi:NDUB4 dehydrogenase, partial [Dromaius novaehollandiae]|nr:NDUB4 dehydrogenase [Dromaius novaehollandiae]
PLSRPQEDPALIRWAYARTQNVYPTFRPTPKTSFLGAVFAVGPILFWIYVFKADRDRKEKLIQEGKYKRPLSLF